LLISDYVEPEELERIVCAKLKELGITKGEYPINPYDIIYNENIYLKTETFQCTDIKGMLINGESMSTIILNSNRTEDSIRFTAMHELFHFWYHPKMPHRICCEDYFNLTKGVEWQANNAAAYALIPYELLLDKHFEFNGDIPKLCSFFKVSKLCMTNRISNIKIPTRKIFIPKVTGISFL